MMFVPQDMLDEVREIYIKRWQGMTIEKIREEYIPISENDETINEEYTLMFCNTIADKISLTNNRRYFATRVLNWLERYNNQERLQKILNFTNEDIAEERNRLYKDMQEFSIEHDKKNFNLWLKEEYVPFEEKELITFIEKLLIETGYVVAREKKTKYGVIDIYAKKRNCELLIEAKKRKATIGELHRALGQLLFYQKAFPKSILFIATPEQLDKDVEKIYNAYKINWFNKSVLRKERCS